MKGAITNSLLYKERLTYCKPQTTKAKTKTGMPAKTRTITKTLEKFYVLGIPQIKPM